MSKRFLSRAGLCWALHLLLAAVADVPVNGTNGVSNGWGLSPGWQWGWGCVGCADRREFCQPAESRLCCESAGRPARSLHPKMLLRGTWGSCRQALGSLGAHILVEAGRFDSEEMYVNNQKSSWVVSVGPTGKVQELGQIGIFPLPETWVNTVF